MTPHRLTPIIAAATIALGACDNSDEHSPRAAGCNPTTMHCTGDGHAASGDGDDGAAGSGTSEGGFDFNARGVGVFASDRFDQGNTRSFAGNGIVSADGASGARVSVAFAGSGFRLAGVERSIANWFLLDPQTGDDAVKTLLVADTADGSSGATYTGLNFASVTLVDEMLAATATGIERSTGRAQIIVRTVNGLGYRVGLGDAELVAYGDGGAWVTDSLARVTADGITLLANVSASALSEKILELDGPLPRSVAVRASAGAVTVVLVDLTP